MRRHVRTTPALILMAGFAAMAVWGCGSDFFVPVTGTVYGTVVLPDGTPAEDVVVLVEETGLSGRTDARGRFVINDIPSVRPGRIGESYNIRGEYAGETGDLGFVKMHFKVKEQQSYSIGRVTLAPTGTIQGSMVLEGENDASGVVVKIAGLSLSAVSNASGRFVLARVPVFDGYELDCHRPGFQDASVTGVAVVSGATTELPATTLERQE